MAGDGEDPELQIHIRTDADTSGIEAARRGMDETVKTGEGLGHTLREVSVSGRHVNEIFRGISAASEGGARGIGEMVRGLRALVVVTTEAIGATGLGGIALAAGALLGIFTALSRHSHESAEGIKNIGSASEEAAKKMEAIKKAVDEDFVPLEKELKAIEEHFADLNKRIVETSSAASKLASSQKELQLSQLELDKTKAIAAAKSPEEIAYIEKKTEAQKEQIEGTFKLAAAGQDLRDAQVKQAAAEDEAAQKRDVAAQAAGKVAQAQSALDDATAKAKRAVTFSYQDEATATAPIQEGLLTSGHAPIVPQIAAASEKAKSDRAAAFQGVNEARARLKEAQDKAEPLQKQADEAQAALERAQLEVQNKQLTAQLDTKTAINDLAKAILDKESADNAQVTAGGQSKSEIDKEENDEPGKEAKSAERAKEKSDKAEERKEHKEATQAIREARDESREQTKIQKEMATYAKEHTETLKEAAAVADKGAREAHKISRQLVNAGSYDTAP